MKEREEEACNEIKAQEAKFSKHEKQFTSEMQKCEALRIKLTEASKESEHVWHLVKEAEVHLERVYKDARVFLESFTVKLDEVC
eukprot:2103786-Rhodomonas_salina.1